MMRPADDTKNLPTLVSELWELVVTYARQQTLVPLKSLGRYVALGLVGSVFLGLGLVLLSLAGLRALQSQTGSTFRGNWSWAPYLITMAGSLSVAGSATATVRKARRGRAARP
ncbi:MAG: hypothetical protein ACRD0M_12055 [Acidimicrobiales bacterium]